MAAMATPNCSLNLTSYVHSPPIGWRIAGRRAHAIATSALTKPVTRSYVLDGSARHSGSSPPWALQRARQRRAAGDAAWMAGPRRPEAPGRSSHIGAAGLWTSPQDGLVFRQWTPWRRPSAGKPELRQDGCASPTLLNIDLADKWPAIGVPGPPSAP